MPSASPAPELTLSEEDLLDRSPTLARLVRKGRLAPARLAQLLAAGRGKSRPKEPEAWECCGSSCRPCVRELWREEDKVWGEVHPDGESDNEGEGEDGAERKAKEEKEEGEKAQEDEKDQKGSPRVEIGLEELSLDEGQRWEESEAAEEVEKEKS
ncbi:hypothetical protein JCM10207_000331 [Rhodosporidiobolus poonsookiae]